MFGLNPEPHLLFLLLVLGLLSHSVQSIRFEVQSDHFKCITEDIRSKSLTVGNYSIANPNQGQPLPESHKLIVRVLSPSGKVNHLGDHIQSGQFAFQTVEAGNYIACFIVAEDKDKHDPHITLSVDFDWKSGVAAREWTNVAKKTNVDAMASSVMNLLETASSIHAEMSYLRYREDENQMFSWETNTRMFWLSLVSLVVSFSVAGLQLWHLKTFFEKNKIIIFF
ncbi:transmembrane emp24 domain-containing protein p24delta7-like [Lotus japonicus]|uniref:transmembrane emp24 domain-containing protein p24delta7-like n=1 Tax=Lotus japonicus TaxID=34305 RepID=UPI00258EC297|nr:transmembrane emp24 domain-containing protein p24delta7-like [Lotus japonicus]